jgi:hypothetical protein
MKALAGGAALRPANMHTASAPSKPTTWAGRIPQIKPDVYADGLPLHELHYLCCKLVLKPNNFTSRESLFDFAKVFKTPAKQNGVTFSVGDFRDTPIRIREVLFVDSPDCRLYNNAFILRRRILYEDGFPTGDPEIVFKFRNTDVQMAAATDVRPHILGGHRVKFKCQALPLKDRLGGIRMLYSHNVQFPRSNVSENDVLSMATMTKIFPVLASIRNDPGEHLSLVGDTIIEEVLQDIGTLDFGEKIQAGANVALWRTRGEHRPLIGEFNFQIKFNDRKELALDAMKRAEAFFVALQFAAQDWITLDATKTGVVYRLHGNAPRSHE